VRGRLFWAGVLAVVVVIALVAGSPSRSDSLPLSPSSTDPTGTRALVLLLEELGGDVDVSGAVPDSGRGTALLLRDGLADDERARLGRWVAAGGVLVVADPESSFVPKLSDRSPDERVRSCEIAALTGVARLDAPDAVAFDAPAGTVACFGGLVTITDRDNGTVVAIGSLAVFTNELIGQFDNSVLLAALLAPTTGTHVTFLDPRGATGHLSLLDLVARRVKQAVVQLGVAFLFYALWRARRLGRPVAESQPVQIAGSELVGAIGQLLRRRHDPAPAAALLRADTRRRIAPDVGMTANAPVSALAAAVAARTGADPEHIASVIADTPISGDAGLVVLAGALESVRQEVRHGRQ